jgi:cupin 2 domain-containing protein
MSARSGNLFADLPPPSAAEEIMGLLQAPGLRLERIVSTGQATPAGEWLDQDHEEWVVLLRGAAGLRLESEANPRLLAAGDYLRIPAHCRHRVEWTAAGEATIWLAFHYQ